jgi:hypothetical protein
VFFPHEQINGKSNPKVKGVGQECPTHTSKSTARATPRSKASDRSVRHTLAANINGKSNTNLNIQGVGQSLP